MCALLVLQQLAILLRPSVLQTPVPRHRAAAFLASREPAANGATMLSNAETSAMLSELQLTADAPLSVPPRGVFCTRSLDLTKIKCIGYDMDYTLIDYKMEVWEARAYHYSKEELRAKGFPVSGLKFKPELVCRGLIIDTERGNLLKVDRFGYVRRAMHGTRMLSRAETYEEYGRSSTVDVDLRSDRWSFLNTLFSVSEGCLYMQLVDRLDSGALIADSVPPFDPGRCSSYSQLFRAVQRALFRAHVQSTLKSEVMQHIERFVNFDPEASQALLEQRRAGKKLALITNSDWVYTRTLMEVAFEPFLPGGMRWWQLFDVVVVSACKPDFFTETRRPLYSVATADGMLREALRMELGGQYAGGNARMVEKVTRCRGEEFLYVGDHIFTDVNMAKRCLSWRTCMILQELEQEVVGLDQGREEGQQLRALMSRRDEYAALRCHVRSELQRRRAQRDDGGGGICGGDGDGGSGGGTPSEWEVSAVASEERLREAIEACEAQIQPMVETEGAHVNRYWGYLSRAGWADKSHLMRQIEKYADIYTSRISNLLAYTAYFRFTASPQSLQHDVPHAHLKVRSAATGSGDIPRVSPRSET
mmetsp:Transcript_33191/g.109724  ORF Transcript_33191/g.109724 Transcript_33191/m.109724 type:complete len:590 (-) Transcript_33191:120-1889(-)